VSLKLKQNLIITIVGVCLFAALMNFSTVLAFGEKVVELVLPVIVGGILALFLNVPVTGIEYVIKKIVSKCKKRPSDKVIHIISFVITILCISAILAVVFVFLIPELVQSAKNLWTIFKTRGPEWIEFLDKHNINSEWLKEMLNKTDFKQLMQDSSGKIGLLLGGVASTVSSVVNVAITAVFGLVIAIYIILDKERIRKHAYKFLFTCAKKTYAEKISLFCNKFSLSFKKFLSGQCAEAAILGVLMSIAFLIFGIPYAGLAGVLTAICAIIPYVGAFISFGVCAFLTLLIDPTLGVKCIIVYLSVQFIENQFIYPRVVGNSVGLPPVYTLIAALIGGKLFGVLGILFFIPIAAVIVELVGKKCAKNDTKAVNSHSLTVGDT
jgi:predicted PurR-regulated permease PerM